MAEDVVVKDPLTPEMVNAGAELVEQLDRLGRGPAAALWYYTLEPNRWRLLLATPGLAQTGPLAAYGNVQNALGKLAGSPHVLELGDVSVVEVDDPLITLLREALPAGPGNSGVRFSKSAFGGRYIEDAFIYRL